MLVLKDRLLSKSGTSIVDDDRAAQMIVEHGCLKDGYKVHCSKDSKNYELIYGEDIIFNEFEEDIEEPIIEHTEDHVDCLVNLLEKSDRYNEKYVGRVIEELEFFSRTNNIKFLLALNDLILEFKNDGVVWGVGRGSSVSSYVLYCLYIHDINPLEYDIPFKELSKE